MRAAALAVAGAELGLVVRKQNTINMLQYQYVTVYVINWITYMGKRPSFRVKRGF
jgi:hypothetical protein